jgi:protein-tyrosine-phosphatase
LVVEIMKEAGIDPTPVRLTAEQLRETIFDFVIALDKDSAAEAENLTAVEKVQWKFENPLQASTDVEMQRRGLRSLRNQLSQRLRLFDIVHVRPNRSEQTYFAGTAPKAAHVG